MKKTILLFLLTFCLFNIYAQKDIHDKVDELIIKGDFKNAELIAKKELDKNPNDPRTICALACVYRNLSYKEVINANLSNYIRDDQSQGEIDLTEENFEKIFNPVYYFEDSIFQKAIDLYHRIFEIDPHYKDAYMNLINAYENDNEYDDYFKTIELYTENNKELENTKYILLELASKLFQKEDTEQALKLYNHIIDEYANFSEAISDLGALYFNLSEFEKADSLFEKSLQINPNDTLIIDNLLKLNIVLGNYDKAFKYSQDLVAKSKSNFNKFSAGSLEVLVDNNNKYLEKFIQERKQNINKKIDEDFWLFISSKLNEVPIDTGLYEDAIYQFYTNDYHFDLIVLSEIVLRNDNTNGYILQLLTSTYEKLEYTEKVIEMLRLIESLNENEAIMPNNYLMFNFGRNFFVGEYYEDAIKYLLKVKDPKKYIVVNYLIGESYYYLNDYENSILYHEKNNASDDKEDIYYINKSIKRLKELRD